MKPDVFKKLLWKIALCSFAALSLIIDFSLLFVEVDLTADSLIKSASIWVNGFDYTGAICLAVMIALLSCMGMYIYAIIATLLNKKMILYPFALPFALHVGFFIISLIIEFYGFLGGFLLVFAAIVNVITLGASIAYGIIMRDKKKSAEDKEEHSHRRALILAAGALSTIVTVSLLFVPFCQYESIYGEGTGYIIPLGVISTLSYIPTHLAVFFATFAACVCSFTSLMGCFRVYSDEISKLADKVKGVLALNFSFTGSYFVSAVAYASLKNSKGGAFTVNCYWPLIFMIAIGIFYCICVRSVNFGFIEQNKRISRGSRVEFFVYSMLISIAAIGSAVSDILRVKFTTPELNSIRINGLTILKSYNSIEAGFQLVAFLVLIILVATAALFVASLLSLISGSKLFYKITLASSVMGVSSTFLIGLFGKYYEIVQKMNVETIKNVISSVYGDVGVEVVFKVQSQSFYWFLGAVAVMCIIILRRPYSRGTMSEAVLEVAATIPSDKQDGGDSGAEIKDSPAADASKANADPAPALTLIDKQMPKFKQENADLAERAFDTPSLPALVNFVVEYAKNSRLHLFYTTKDIAAFVAGLGATRLTILQGMSGTGKTSLPKIFTEAVLGTCDIVEVESSWRDKNELLGYYNEFSRTYTPKKFTQALYKARLCPERLTFIVLDEMNLSRIEYYFSDFLSLMENEEDKREIKLLNVALARREEDKTYRYLGLESGHTLKVPKNVWFIGTANRDESTFEISDKVYDRAHTMNFNKRAKRINVTEPPIEQRFLSADELARLLENAKSAIKFDVDSSHVVKEVEELLAPYNISFGNRIANQIEAFVSIYCSCFADPYSVIDEALETILLSKVVAKLETRSVDNKDALAAEFARLGLERCSEFVRGLHED